MSEAVTAPSGKQRTCVNCATPLAEGETVCSKCGTAWIDGAPAGDAPTQAVAANPPEQKTDLGVGETLLGQWKLETKIGEGGMGNVFLATELKLGRKVAVKALSVENLQDETVKRFEREAQVMGKLDHPNIVTLYAVGRHRDVPFLVMRHLEGGSLWDLLDANGGRLTPDQLVPLVKQLCAALGYIHGKNLIHRDLKPSNIFISPQGKVTLLDLGLARGHTTALTRTGIIWGTPDFMAPEQIVGEKQLDGRADLYALAVVLYRMISNTPPFPDEDEQNLMRAHLTKPRPDISKVWFGASQALSLMLQKGMAIKPEDRFQTSEEFSQAFERVAMTREQSTRAVPQPVAAPPSSRPIPAAPHVASGAGAAPTAQQPPPAAPAAVEPAPAAPPPPLAKPSVLQPAPTVTGGKGKIIDELDDDATELGELPPHLMEAIAKGELGKLDAEPPKPAPAPAMPKKTSPETPAAVRKMTGEVAAYKPDASKRAVTGEAPAHVPRKSVSEPAKKPPVLAPRPSAPTPGATVSDRPSMREVSSASTTVDRPDGKRPAPIETIDTSGERPAVVTSPAGYAANPAASGTMTDDEPATGENPMIRDEAGSGPMMVKTGDIEPVPEMEDAFGDDDPKTEIGLPMNEATSIMAPANPDPEPTKALAGRQTAPPRASAPRASAPPRRSSVTGVRKEQSRPPQATPAEEETPPWMHPYVLVTGGLLLLALGFLIGVLLR